MHIALIPARIGSKRIKEKNIKNFLGRPIIFYVIKNILESRMFNKIYISTDSTKIKNLISKKFKKDKVKIIFREKKYLSSDNATSIEVINAAYKQIKIINKTIKFLGVFYPTSIFIKKKHIVRALNILKKKNAMVFACKKYSHPIDRALKIDGKGLAKFINLKTINKKTQNFDKYYYDLGQFYFFRDEFLKNKKKFITGGFPIILKDYEAFDIDNKEDWEIAKKLYKIKLY